jgi:hypothetical protein
VRRVVAAAAAGGVALGAAVAVVDDPGSSSPGPRRDGVEGATALAHLLERGVGGRGDVVQVEVDLRPVRAGGHDRGSLCPDHRRHAPHSAGSAALLASGERMTCDASGVGDRYKPVVVAVAAGILSLVLPGELTPVVVIAGALVAGWFLPGEPVVAAALFLVPGVVAGTLRILIDGDAPSIGALALVLLCAVLFVAVLTHLGAGLALRRRTTPGR